MFVQRPLPAGMMEGLTGWASHDELASWTGPGQEGSTMTVRAYTGGDAVALLLNGQEVARKMLMPADKCKATFNVSYAPGTITAVAFARGKEIGRRVLTTVGPAAGLHLRAEQPQIASIMGELAYVFAEVVDSHGQLVPDAAVPITFAANGAARLLRAGSANPYGIESFQDARTRSFHGVAQAILQPIDRRGEAVLHVSSHGLTSDSLTVQIE